MKHVAVLAVMVALALVNPRPGFPQATEQPKALSKEFGELKDGQKAIRKALQQIRVSLLGEGNAKPPELDKVVLDLGGAWAKGEKTARVTIVEFMDYQCPMCARHFRDVLPRIDAEFIKAGKVRYVLRDYPLETVHPYAFNAAVAAWCAGDQGKYWEMHDRLLSNQGTLASKNLPDHALALGLDGPTFQRCLDSGRHEDEIRKDIDAGLKAGLAGTPTFFLGVTEGDDPHVKLLRRVPGTVEYVVFKRQIESLLSRSD